MYLREKSTQSFRSAAAKGFSKGNIPDDEDVIKGLRNSNYGNCVYYAGNDVVDNQIVNMQFEGGVTASLLMNAFNYGGRYIRIFGTKGELYANAKDTEITVFTFENRETTTISVPEVDESIAGGHGGGDGGIVSELYEYLSGSYKGFCAADIDTSVKNHMIGFAAEEARKEGNVKSVAEYLKKYDY